MNLSWTASTDNVGVQGYKLYRNGTYVSAIGPIGSASVSDTGLTSGTAYSYTVSAIDGAGNESGQSTIANATPAPDNIFPSIPTGLAATAVAWNAVNLSWAPSTDNIGVTRYTVSRGGTVLSVQAGSTTTFTDRTTAPTTAYSYTVTATDAAGNTSAAPVAAPVTTPLADTALPSTPTALTATSVSTSQVNLQWSAATDNLAVQGYKVYRNGIYVSTIGPVGSTSLSDTGLTNGTMYTYAVTAIDAAGNESAQSGAASATTGPDTVAPSIPAGLAVNGASSTHLTLSWTASTDNVGVTGYKVFRLGVLVYLTGPTTVGATDWNVTIAVHHSR